MAQEQLEEGQIVLCTVDKIAGTTVFVKIDGNGEGILTTSEIAPGRIRNLRDYVVPNKKIVCKILSIKGDRIHLSLRRVKQSERKELLEKIKKEKNYTAILKTILGEGYEEIIKKITTIYSLSEIFENIEEGSELIEKYLTKEQLKKLLKFLELKKDKPKEIKQIFRLSNKSQNGIVVVKETVRGPTKDSNASVNYLAAGRYSLKLQGTDFKELKIKMHKIMESIEKQAKKNGCEFSVEK